MPGGRVAMRGHDGRCYQYNESGSMRICCTTCMSSPTWKRVYSWWDVRGSNSNLPECLRGRNIAWELNSRTLRHKIRKPVQTYTRHNMCRKLSVAGLSGVFLASIEVSLRSSAPPPLSSILALFRSLIGPGSTKCERQGTIWGWESVDLIDCIFLLDS